MVGAPGNNVTLCFLIASKPFSYQTLNNHFVSLHNAQIHNSRHAVHVENGRTPRTTSSPSLQLYNH